MQQTQIELEQNRCAAGKMIAIVFSDEGGMTFYNSLLWLTSKKVLGWIFLLELEKFVYFWWGGGVSPTTPGKG